MPFNTREIDRALRAKGFRRAESHHTMYVLYRAGLKTPIRTKVSHSRDEYGDSLLAQMARQLSLSRGELNELIRCPLSHERYIQLLVERGRLVDSAGPGASSDA